MSSDADTDSTEESDGESDSEHDSDVDMRMEDNVDAPYGVDLDSDGDIERDGDDEEEEVEEEQDEDEEDDDEDEDEDEVEDDGNEPRTIAQGEIVNTSAGYEIPWYTISQPCYLSRARRCASIPPGRNLSRLPHGNKPRNLAHDHKLRRLIRSEDCSFWACDATRTSPSGANPARHWRSEKHLGCRCGAAATSRIGRWRQSPKCPFPWCFYPRCPAPGTAADWFRRQEVNHASSRWRGVCSAYGHILVLWVTFSVIYSSQALINVRVEVFCLFGLGLWPCLFPLF